jgi:hypothetical protein
MLEHVSLSFNKKWHSRICTCGENNNVRMKSISYWIHGNMLRMYDVCASKIARKFQEHVNHTLVIRLSDEVANLISLLYVKLYKLPISSGAIRCNKISVRSEDFLRL